jgi:hypothetical protein
MRCCLGLSGNSSFIKLHSSDDMSKANTYAFPATIDIIGVNPFVLLPEAVLESLIEEAGRHHHRGKIPVTMEIDGHSFSQTLVKYSGQWRLYLNTPMRAAGKQVGDTAAFRITFNPRKTTLQMPQKLQQALAQCEAARQVYDALAPSLQLEISRYLSRLKTEATMDRNVARAIRFLLGQERFIGREPPGKTL